MNLIKNKKITYTNNYQILACQTKALRSEWIKRIYLSAVFASQLEKKLIEMYKSIKCL